MKKAVGLFLFFLFFLTSTQAQKPKVILVTLDGMRWQEVFGGVDEMILKDKKFTSDSGGLAKNFWDADPTVSRKKIFPFLWETIFNQGVLMGNRKWSNMVNVSNPYKFSYPGYNEILTGYPDTLVNSNNKNWNANTTVLEFINNQPGHKGKVAAFASWDVFPFIINKKRSGIYVNADQDSLLFPDTSLRLINDMQTLTPQPVNLRPDVFTYFAAREYLKAYQPELLYIAFDETDDFAHAGMYDQYLKSAHSQDKMLADLWRLVQSLDGYKNNTTLIITTDHGRGYLAAGDWRHHGQGIPVADQIWIAAIGKGIPAMGEDKRNRQVYQKQIAATIAQFFGKKFTASHPVADPIHFE